MKRLRFIHSWLLPLNWGAVALLSMFFRGGENIVLLAGLMPGILFLRLIRLGAKPEHASNQFWPFLAYGLLFMIPIGLVLDWSKVRRKVWYVAAGSGTILTMLFMAWRFKLEVSRSGWDRAVSLFEFDNFKGAASMAVLCLLGGVYIGTILALPGSWANCAYQWWSTKRGRRETKV